MDAAAPTFAPGTVIGEKYRLDRELGRGGMGAVFAATNLVLDVPVAIKVLHVGANPSPRHASRFLQEARAAGAVRHANIVRIVDFGQDAASGVLYLVQEFLQGHDLKKTLQLRGPMAPAEAIELLLPVMRALSWAHAKNIVHRDLKPDNIFLEETPDGVVPKIIDFGIAKVTDAEGQSAQNTATAQVLGTPYYMSPEQTRGDRAVDHRTDVWALGVVLYHMLTGRHPHEGATANLVMASIITRPPRPVTDFAPMLPPPVVALVDGALRDDAAARYPTMEAFWSAARECLTNLGVVVPPAPTPASKSLPTPERVSSQPKPTTPADMPTVAPQVMATDTRTPPRLRSLAVVVVGGLAITAALGGYWSARTPPQAVDASASAASSTTRAARSPTPERAVVTPVRPAAPATTPTAVPPTTTAALVASPSRGAGGGTSPVREAAPARDAPRPVIRRNPPTPAERRTRRLARPTAAGAGAAAGDEPIAAY